MPKRISSRVAAAPKPTRGEPVYSKDGVDLTLIRWMLSLTPTERLEVLQEHIWSIMRLRGEDTET
jgi:hypothetical protein